jgi:endonuclease III
MNAEKRFEIFKRLSVAIPQPTTELEYRSTFELLIAVILSAQATDKGVNIATRKLFKAANTPQAIFDLGTEGLESYIRTIGLYHAKTKNILACCEMLLSKHDGEVPNTREALEALPGVGRKTANVVLNTAFGLPTIAVDTHLFRLGNRTKLATGKNVLQVEQKYLKSIPKEFMQDAHHLLILHGRYTCTARNPKCGECCIVDLCEYAHKVIPKPHLMAGEAMTGISMAGEAMTGISMAGEAMTEQGMVGEA